MWHKLVTIALLVVLVLCSCEAEQGPAGPVGPQGPAGPTGPMGPAGQDGEDGLDGQDGQDGRDGVDGQDGEDGAGTRIVYTSTVPIPDMQEYYFSIPEIKLNDLPLVSVYSAFASAPGEWAELPIYSDTQDYTMFYYLSEGRVYVYNCQGLWIKIVLVI